MVKVRIQTEDFNINTEVEKIKNHSNTIGAVVSFVGCVREVCASGQGDLTLEHYPKMTEKVITDIIKQAHQKWQIQATTVIHRVGKLATSDNIVLVICASKHRQDAFLACEFVMDFLKTNAPFWKKETNQQGNHWLETNKTDQQAHNKWHD